MSALVAVVPVDAGELAVGGDEVIAEAGGRCVLIGSGVESAVAAVAGLATEVVPIEIGPFLPASWADALAGVLDHEEATLVLPGSPDGRDLAPRLAHLLDRPLVSGAVRVDDRRAVVVAHGGVERDVVLRRPAVVVMLTGVRAVEFGDDLDLISIDVSFSVSDDVTDAEILEILPADPATIDLAEARRVVAGGAGLGSAAALDRLGEVGLALGASLGATRVLTDAGWIAHTRQIGTTGVEIDPVFYLAVGISGAVQHLMGIGDPEHVIAVNTDPSCPMMNRADLALVTDAPAFVEALAQLLLAEIEP